MSLKLKVWWIPQIPGDAFEVEVATVEEGKKLCAVLADYDAFQFSNKIKPDYCNMGGIVFSHPGIPEFDWSDVPDDPDEYEDWLKEIAEADARIEAGAQP